MRFNPYQQLFNQSYFICIKITKYIFRINKYDISLVHFNFKGKLLISQLILCLLSIKHTKTKLTSPWRSSLGSAHRPLGSISGAHAPAKGLWGHVAEHQLWVWTGFWLLGRGQCIKAGPQSQRSSECHDTLSRPQGWNSYLAPEPIFQTVYVLVFFFPQLILLFFPPSFIEI